ncbi:alpha-ketoglutarate permease [Niastella koreensis]|uniref:Major facilitator superfamily MFS_1 n=2 Tax=Niastella koreensis TaxID=354356 RepID=G8TM44_NIAKG|nr:MFS transporter [Niastella koreensis]AEV99817.1 major facilitator superfamily MFS_1 [Niastella koreensis GR20-10]OQP51564.1 alpha-ketoglutarate permease [Niastella koreensis]
MLQKNNNSFADKTGIPMSLLWGYVGILIFMMGDGMETGWLSPYLKAQGMTIEQNATLFTAYGITVAISAWFSGVLAEGFGPKKTMLAGLLLYLAGTTGFVGYGLAHLNFPVMIITYALRGFGYPLFAYSFMVWIAYQSPKEKLGRAVGWFWFVFTGGLNVLGAFYSSWAIKSLGYINTLWSSVFWVLIGAFFALLLNKASFKTGSNGNGAGGKARELLKGLTIIQEEPKVLIGGIVRIINTTAQFAFPVFLPMYMEKHGFDTTTWLQIWGTIFTSNIIFNLIFGFVGDRLGWRNTIMWFGGIGCAITTLGLYYVPQAAPGNFAIVLAAGILWGACLAGYVPLSALVPSLVKKDKGAAIAILNLGAGLPVFVGPALVGLFFSAVGEEGIIWILAVLYFISALLTKFITLPDNAKTLHQVKADNTTLEATI